MNGQIVPTHTLLRWKRNPLEPVLIRWLLSSFQYIGCAYGVKLWTLILLIGTFDYEQVRLVVKKKESLKKISFLAHSLGGLIARYALGVLYSSDNCNEQYNDAVTSTSANLKPVCSSNVGLIAGLEPVNFITLATPHLGVRGKNQVCSHGTILSLMHQRILSQCFLNGMLFSFLIKVIYLLYLSLKSN